MGFRIRRSFSLMPGVRVSVSNRSVGISGGTRGARVSLNSSGRRTTSLGVPGTDPSAAGRSGHRHGTSIAIADGIEAREVLTGVTTKRTLGGPLKHRALIERANGYLAEGRRSHTRRDLERVLGENAHFPGLRKALAHL